MNKKDQIILSALELFAKYGYTETSIDKIAKHAKVSKGLTYAHFKNKDDLLRATIENTITQMTSEMMEIKELNIKSLLKNFFKGLDENKDVIRLCLLLVVHPQTPALVNTMLEKQKYELLELFSILLKDKFHENSLIEAELLLATIDGITLDFVTNPNARPLIDIENYIINKYSN
jgi:AcrR family transcriptional regulator